MPQTVQGVIAKALGEPVSSPRSSFPTRPGGAGRRPGLRGLPHRPALSRSGIGDDFPTCSAMRQPGSSRWWGMASPTWRPATS